MLLFISNGGDQLKCWNSDVYAAKIIPFIFDMKKNRPRRTLEKVVIKKKLCLTCDFKE